jgi:chromosome segregation ATPase
MAALIRQLTGQRGALAEDTREEEPPNVRALEEAKAEAEDDMKNIEAQAAGGNEQLAELIARMTPLAHRRTDFEALSNQRDQIRLARNEEITNAARQRVTATAAVTQYKQEITRLQAKVQAAEAAVDTAGEHLQTALDTATAICPRENVVLSGRRRDKLETMINSLEKALQDRERRVGGSSEAIHNRLVDAKRVYDENKQTVDDLKAVLVVRLLAVVWLVG